MLDFKKDLQKSHSPEIQKKLYPLIVRMFDLKVYKPLELLEIKGDPDGVGIRQDGSKLNIEIKTSKFYESTIPIEITSINGLDGWAFKIKQDEIDYVVFYYEGLYIVFNDGLQEFWEQNYKKYPERKNQISGCDGNTWQSSYTWVPIKDFPEDIIYTKNFP